MPTPILIDSSYILALVDRRDQNHSRAIQLVSKYDNVPMIVTAAILLEIGASLAYGFRKQVIQIIEEFQTSPNIEIIPLSPELFEQAFQYFKKHQDKEWSLTDCVSFVEMQQRGISQALTFDHHFQQAGFIALMRED